MKRLVIFADLYQVNHESLYKNIIKKLPEDCHIDFIIGDKTGAEGLDSNKIKFHFKKKGESMLKFIRSKTSFFKSANLIIIEELYNPNFAILIPIIEYGHKCLQIIHNANKFLNRNLKPNFKSIAAFVFFKIIKLSIKGIIVISQNVKEYIIDQKLFDRNIYYIPFSDAKNNFQFQDENSDVPIKFTIPGTVNSERRNYKLFLKVFIDILENNPHYKLRLCFLGKVVKIDDEVDELINKLKQIDPEALNLWTDYIDDETYHKNLLNSHYLIGNINIDYLENDIEETYGQSKETGVLFLMLKYKIPTLFPEQYSYSKLYGDYIINYRNSKEELYDTIFKLLNSNLNEINTSLDEHEHYVNKEWSRVLNEF